MTDQDQYKSEIITEHSDYLLAFAMTKVQDIDLAKDLVQDALVAALTKLESFEKRSSLRTWLTSILNRKIIDYWRKAETRYTDNISSYFDSSSRHWLDNSLKHADLSTVEDQIINEESRVDLFNCIGELPSKWKGIVVAKYLEDLDTEEICKEYDVTPSNLWVIMHLSLIHI